MQFKIITLFPELFVPFLNASLIGKARAQALVSFDLIQLRDFADSKHRTVDDTPYGGGEGMVLKVDVLHAAWKSVTFKGEPKTLTVLTSPQGQKWDQPMAKELAGQFEKIVIVCGHYEGIDERFVDLCVDREVSVGDYVLTGGELPALIMADSITRLLPGVVGNADSVARDSLEGGLLKYPQYTKPREYEGLAVPPLLLGGNHAQIACWRQEERVRRTQQKRPDLLTQPKT